jgi:hypothetical protein
MQHQWAKTTEVKQDKCYMNKAIEESCSQALIEHVHQEKFVPRHLWKAFPLRGRSAYFCDVLGVKPPSQVRDDIIAPLQHLLMQMPELQLLPYRSSPTETTQG